MMQSLQQIAEQIFELRNALLTSKELHDLLWDVCWSITSNEETARDLFAEGILLTAYALHLYVPSEGAFSTFVHRRVKPKLVEYMHRYSAKEVSIDESKIPGGPPDRSLSELLDELWARDETPTRSVAFMRLVEGYTFAEIAQRLNMDRREVKSIYTSAMMRLKRLMTDEEETHHP